MPVVEVDSPLTCVAIGSGQALAHYDDLISPGRRVRTLTS